MIKKFKNISITKPEWSGKIAWTLVLSLIAMMLVFSIGLHNQSTLTALRVKINDTTIQDNSLITPKEVHAMITGDLGKSIKELEIINLDLAWLEGLLEKDSRVANAELFLDGLKYLNVTLDLRKPIIRIMSSNDSENYYLDTNGEKIILVKGTPIRVPVITGDIDAYNSNWKKIKAHSLHEVMVLANAVRNDKFLWALTEQVHRMKNGSFRIIPKLGKPLDFGSIEDMNHKLENIKGLYKDVYPHKGWDNKEIESIKLDIPNQFVLVKKDKIANS